MTAPIRLRGLHPADLPAGYLAEMDVSICETALAHVAVRDATLIRGALIAQDPGIRHVFDASRTAVNVPGTTSCTDRSDCSSHRTTNVLCSERATTSKAKSTSPFSRAPNTAWKSALAVASALAIASSMRRSIAGRWSA